MMSEAELDAAIAGLEREMPDFPHRYHDLFAFANAWAERYDAIIAQTPREHLASVERRLKRIGVRWGTAAGVRTTIEFPSYKAPA